MFTGLKEDFTIEEIFEKIEQDEEQKMILKADILSLLISQPLEELFERSQVSTSIRLLALISEYKTSDYIEYIHDNREAISTFIRDLHYNFADYLASLPTLLDSPKFLEKFTNDINFNNLNIVRGLCTTQNEADTKEKLFYRLLYCIEMLT